MSGVALQDVVRALHERRADIRRIGLHMFPKQVKQSVLDMLCANLGGRRKHIHARTL